MKEMWDARYSADEYAYGTAPNAWFAEQLKGLAPGTLLLPAEGEGRNAVHAARMGWKVTAFDLSERGRDKALLLAAQHGVHITYHVGQLHELPELSRDFDAIGFFYAHFAANVRVPLTATLLGHLRPGGTVLFEAFAKEQLKYQPLHNSGGPREADMLYTVDELRAEMPGIAFRVLEEAEVRLDEGPFHQGLAKVVRGVGVKG
ncbi:MAG: class I SAM-dependent methyltransferase [Flavobacteriales bacterium]|nr:class I SAM-dependent methyltransferase [Flavobacteriales bacterium]